MVIIKCVNISGTWSCTLEESSPLVTFIMILWAMAMGERTFTRFGTRSSDTNGIQKCTLLVVKRHSEMLSSVQFRISYLSLGTHRKTSSSVRD